MSSQNHSSPTARSGWGDEGSVSIYMVVFFLPLLMAVGLVFDGGAKVEAIGQARDLADNAARVGAQQVATSAYRGGVASVPIDQTDAAQAVDAYLSATQAQVVTIRFPQADRIEVEVEIEVDYLLLPGGATVSATGAATTEQG